jgi:hypothetical protein
MVEADHGIGKRQLDRPHALGQVQTRRGHRVAYDESAVGADRRHGEPRLRDRDDAVAVAHE